ncbi:MAG TPA: NlpC/P60 family protein [Actinomycetota bacterium]|nr:NlpC/P60 family protein [Actinomycetota bacterium]
MTTRRLAAIFLLVAAFLLPAALVQAAPSRAELQASLNRLEREIGILDEDYNESRIELTKLESQIRSAKQNKADAEEDLKQLRTITSRRAVAVYKAGVPNVLEVLLTSDSMSDFERRMGVANKVGNWESGLITSLEMVQTRAEQRTEDLQQDLDEAKKIKDSIDQRRKGLQQKVAEQKRLLDELAKQEAAAAAARERARRAAAAAASPKPKPSPTRAQMPESLPASGSARIAVQEAYNQIGKPYQWGADGPDSFDCSGLTMWSWRKAGVSLPHSSRAQYSSTRRVAREDLQPGDLVFFGSPIHHVGIYIGDGNMINAPESGQNVGIRSMNRRDYVGAGRPGV